MLSDSDKSANHEVCSSDYDRFYRVGFASISGIPTAFSGESSTSVWR
jgi:hypothetical protein